MYQTIFFCQSIDGWPSSLVKIVPCDPKLGHSSLEGPGEDRQRVEKVIIDDLVGKFEQDICYETQKHVCQGDSGNELFPKIHGGDSMSGIGLVKSHPVDGQGLSQENGKFRHDSSSLSSRGEMEFRHYLASYSGSMIG